MAEPGAATCPRCGGALLARLGEYECARCGHFIPSLTKAKQPATAIPPPLPPILDTPQPARSRLLGATPLDARSQHLTLEKQLFIITGTILVAAGNCLAFAPPRPAPGVFLALIGAAALIGALAALMLYANWQSFQQLAALAVIAGLGFYAYSVYAGWPDLMWQLKVKLCVDGALLVWLDVLLWRSSIIAD